MTAAAIEGRQTADLVCFVSLDGGQSTYKLRPEVAEFATAMEIKLCKNDHKTGWKDQPIEAHIRLLRIELMEFDVAFEFLGDKEAASECVDIANFALIIRDKLLARIKAQSQQPKSLGATQATAHSTPWSGDEPKHFQDARNAFAPDGDWTK